MPNLSNNGLQNLFIDGKAVKKASLGGKVFFEKHDYNLSVVSDKDILSYADGDSATLTARLTDYGEPVEGETVVFSCDDAIETSEVSSSGTYDFGEVFTIYPTNLQTETASQSGGYNLQIGTGLKYIRVQIDDEGDCLVTVSYSAETRRSGYINKIEYNEGILTLFRDSGDVEYDLSNEDIDFNSWSILEGESVTVEIPYYKSVTDSNGECSVGYDSKGTGDLNIQVEVPRILLQETYELEDCIKYDITEHTKSYSSTQFETIEDLSTLTDCSISLDLKTTTYDYSCVFGKSYNDESDQIGYGTTDTTGRIYRTFNGTNNHSYYSGFNQNNVYYNLRFERTGTTLKLYLNDILIDTSTNNEISSFKYLNFGSWRNKTIYYKNLKIKTL